MNKQTVRVATQYAPSAVRRTPDAAAQLQPIPYACGGQRACPIAVCAMNINELL